jgi:hypothetical protein
VCSTPWFVRWWDKGLREWCELVLTYHGYMKAMSDEYVKKFTPGQAIVYIRQERELAIEWVRNGGLANLKARAAQG